MTTHVTEQVDSGESLSVEESLKMCPVCKYSRQVYEGDICRGENLQQWDAYAPELFRDTRLVDGWNVFCNCCGFTALFRDASYDHAAELWNGMSREGDSK